MSDSRKNVITGLFAVTFGAVMYIGITPRFVVTTDALNHTSPDTFPNFISAVMILLGIVLLVKTYFEQKSGGKKEQKEINAVDDGKEKKPFTSSEGYHALVTFADMVIFVFLLEKIGYVASSMVACCGLLAAYRSKKWHYYVTVIMFTLVLNYIFSVVLHVKMP